MSPSRGHTEALVGRASRKEDAHAEGMEVSGSRGGRRCGALWGRRPGWGRSQTQTKATQAHTDINTLPLTHDLPNNLPITHTDTDTDTDTDRLAGPAMRS